MPNAASRPRPRPKAAGCRWAAGDRSQRIRTYSFPQGRITDHRVEGLTLYDLPNIIAGELDTLVERLIHEHQADELAQLAAGT